MGRIDGLVGKVEELESDMKAMRLTMIEQISKFEERLKLLEASLRFLSLGSRFSKRKTTLKNKGYNNCHYHYMK